MNTGGTGGAGTNTGGGGGGGAGTKGGTGGGGGDNGTDHGAGVGGDGGSSVSINGSTGSSGGDGGGGGGGGGGAHGFTGNSLPAGSVFGGTGGTGGNGSSAIDRRQNGGGGGGGAGGYGAVVSSSNSLGTITGNINGGAGGNGGNGGISIGLGGAGGQGGTGGIALQLIGSSQVTVGSGVTITGGTGGMGGFGPTFTGLGGNGGIGIAAASASLANDGTINGGMGGTGGPGAAQAAGFGPDVAANGGNGGHAVSLTAGGALANNGGAVITGGTGGTGGEGGNATGAGGAAGNGGVGGAGVAAGGSALSNAGFINGGKGGTGGQGLQSQGGTGGTGGDGVSLFGTGATLTNSGTITGGTAGNGGFGQGANGSGSRGGNGGTGGNAVSIVFGNLVNSNTINGGQGGNGVVGPDAVGSGGNGGNGVLIVSGTGTNTGTITGGTAGNGQAGSFHIPPSPGKGGAGGSGVLLDGGSFTNNGTVNGGAGGAGGGAGSGGPGGDGGNGITVINGDLIHTGAAYGGTGGPGGSGGGTPGAGGSGVWSNNGTLTNSGTIVGGFSTSGVQADAITFGTGVNILQLQVGSNIQGVVNANAGSNDTLALGGTASGSINVSQIGAGQQYQGFERFEKTGVGAWVLSGTTGATGPWAVSQGTLIVNGSLAAASQMTVNPGGVISGSGTLPVIMINGGTIAPGNSIGTISVQGNFVHTGGVHQLEIAPSGQGDQVNVAGTATLNGPTLQVIAAQGSYANSTTYTILNANGGVSGGYAYVAENFAFLTPTLSYDTNNAYLTLALQQNAFSSGAVTANEKAVGFALDRSFANASGDFATVIGALAGLDTAQGPAALNTISGQPWANFGTANVASGALLMNALGQQMALARGAVGASQRQALAEVCDITTCDDARPLSAWMSALGGLGSVLGDGNTSTFTYNMVGAVAGLDYRFDPRFLVGLSVGYTHGTQWTNGFMGQGWSDTVSVAAYGSFTQAGFYVDALAGFAWSTNQLQRQIVIPNLQPRTANGSTSASQFLGQAEAGYRIGIYAPAQASLTPFARLQVQSVTQYAFSESGANSLSLNVAQQGTNSLRSTIGVDLAGQLPLGPASKVAVALRLGWQHEFDDTTRPITAAFAGAPGNAFTVYGATPVRDSAVIGFDTSTAIAEAISLYLRYDGQLGGGTDNHALNVGLRLSW